MTLDDAISGGFAPASELEDQANHAASPQHFTGAVTSKDVVFFLGALFVLIYVLHLAHRAVSKNGK